MAKFIALDVGEKRLGIAKSDDTGTFAFPVTTLNMSNALDGLEEIIDQEKPDKIIVGLPRNMDGTLGFQAEKVQEFAKKNLSQYKLEYEDETATSLEAEKIMREEGQDPIKNKEMIDAYAAKIILESWIKRQK